MDGDSSTCGWNSLFHYLGKKEERNRQMKKLKFCLLSLLTLIIGTFPVEAFAHGTEDEYQRELFLNQFITHGLIKTALLTRSMS
jgi:hypothetical protein